MNVLQTLAAQSLVRISHESCHHMSRLLRLQELALLECVDKSMELRLIHDFLAR